MLPSACRHFLWKQSIAIPPETRAGPRLAFLMPARASRGTPLLSEGHCRHWPELREKRW